MKFMSSHLVDEIEWEHAHFILEKRYSVIFFFLAILYAAFLC